MLTINHIHKKVHNGIKIMHKVLKNLHVSAPRRHPQGFLSTSTNTSL